MPTGHGIQNHYLFIFTIWTVIKDKDSEAVSTCQDHLSCLKLLLGFSSLRSAHESVCPTSIFKGLKGCTLNSKRNYTLCFWVSTQNVGGLGPQLGLW